MIAKSRKLEIRQLQTPDTATSASPSEDGHPTNGNTSSPFPLVWSVPINGRILSLNPFQIPNSPTSLLFVTTDQQDYAVLGAIPSAVSTSHSMVPTTLISSSNTTSSTTTSHIPMTATTGKGDSSSSWSASPYPVMTHASGSFQGHEFLVLGKLAECGPLVAIDPRCIVLHMYDGLLTVFPIHTHYRPPMVSSSITTTMAGTATMTGGGGGGRKGGGMTPSAGISSSSSSSLVSPPSVLGAPFHVRLEERTVLAMTILEFVDPLSKPPHICLLHQDSRGAQHITTHVLDLHKLTLLSPTSSSVAAAAAATTNTSTHPTGSGGGGGGGGVMMGNTTHASMGWDWLKKSRLDGGSSLLISVPPRATHAATASATAATSKSTTLGHGTATAASSSSSSSNSASGGVVILGQRQITYCASNGYKVMPIPPALILSWDRLPPDVSGMPRFLLSDEYGNLHMLTLITSSGMAQATTATTPTSSSSQDTFKVIALQLDTLGSNATLANQLVYLNSGLVFCGSTMGDSQLIQIHDEPIPVEVDDDLLLQDPLELDDTTYLSVVEEYTHLGPIVDFDLVPTTPGMNSWNGPTGSQKKLQQHHSPQQLPLLASSSSSSSGGQQQQQWEEWRE